MHRDEWEIFRPKPYKVEMNVFVALPYLSILSSFLFESLWLLGFQRSFECMSFPAFPPLFPEEFQKFSVIATIRFLLFTFSLLLTLHTLDA